MESDTHSLSQSALEKEGSRVSWRGHERKVMREFGSTYMSALRRHHNRVHEGNNGHMTYVIAEPCIDVKDKSCIEECPVDCIYEGERMLYIQPDECVDCGACEPVCPVEAIYYEDDVPSQWQGFKGYNSEFFNELVSPGGASKVGATGKDHPVVLQIQKKPESN